MKNGFLKVAAATPKIKVADPAHNAKAVCQTLDQCFSEGAKVVVLPELVLTGFTCNDLFLQERLLEEALLSLQEVIDYTKGHDSLVFVGLPFEKDGKLYNVAAAVQDGSLLALIPKRNIPNYAEFYEVRHFAAGNETAEYVDVNGTQVPFGSKILLEAKSHPQKCKEIRR